MAQMTVWCLLNVVKLLICWSYFWPRWDTSSSVHGSLTDTWSTKCRSQHVSAERSYAEGVAGHSVRQRQQSVNFCNTARLEAGWLPLWKTWKSQGIEKWSGKSPGKWFITIIQLPRVLFRQKYATIEFFTWQSCSSNIVWKKKLHFFHAGRVTAVTCSWLPGECGCHRYVNTYECCRKK